jgi:disulfide oxidoreductase YuzD
MGTVVHEVLRAANVGKTQFIYTVAATSYVNTPPSTITTDDLIAAFQRKFPDCDVSYQEIWVEVDATNRVLKKGIVVDWS